VATPREIDAIFKDVLKTPKGPCELMDVVGLDVVLDIEKHYAETRSNLPTEPQTYLQDMIDKGRLGVKNSRRFYKYPRE
jgi:3-hydroxyacyl-CoA dehydrogenase